MATVELDKAVCAGAAVVRSGTGQTLRCSVAMDMRASSEAAEKTSPQGGQVSQSLVFSCWGMAKLPREFRHAFTAAESRNQL